MHTEFPPDHADDGAATPEQQVTRFIGAVVLAFAAVAVLLLVCAFGLAVAAAWATGPTARSLTITAVLFAVAAAVSGVLSPLAGRVLADGAVAEDGPR